MKDGTIDELIADLMMKCGFGAVRFPIEPVTGGLMHRMYRVKTDSGIYAVKHLNPEIMGREGVFDNYARAEKIECLLEKEEIPIVPAITVSGKKNAAYRRKLFLCILLAGWAYNGLEQYFKRNVSYSR